MSSVSSQISAIQQIVHLHSEAVTARLQYKDTARKVKDMEDLARMSDNSDPDDVGGLAQSLPALKNKCNTSKQELAIAKKDYLAHFPTKEAIEALAMAIYPANTDLRGRYIKNLTSEL